MPRLSDSMEEGTILRWLKEDGAHVERGEELVEIETDKATLPYAADVSGRLHIVAAAGETLPIGRTIATIGETNGDQPSAVRAQTGKAKGEATLTIAVSLFMFSVSASIHCERSFAGSNGDPSFAVLMGPDVGSVTDDTQYPWRDYVNAFA